MSLETTYKYFSDSIRNTILGRASPYYTIKEAIVATSDHVKNDSKLLAKIISNIP